jgi:flagellar biogenesis protein FliO
VEKRQVHDKISNMDWLRLILGLRSRSQNGPGMSKSTVLELRMMFFGGVLVLVILGGWAVMKKMEKNSYVSTSIQTMDTAAGKN